MGKSVHHEGSHSSSDGQGSGRTKGILHHFHHNPWNKVMKKLPHRKHGSGKHSTDNESNKTSLEAAEMTTTSDSVVDNYGLTGDNAKKATQQHQVATKDVEPGRSSKSSMKSRIKALIIESKKRSRHPRNSPCPTNAQLDPALPIHNPESSNAESLAEGNKKDEVLRGHDRGNPSALLDPVLPEVREDSPNLNINFLKQSEVAKLVQQPVRDHTLLQEHSIYAIEPSKGASIQESKLFMDALDLLNMRKEVFLRIVHDQSSSLAQQLQTRQKTKMRSGLTKSVSFPVPDSSARQTHGHDNSIERQENVSWLKQEDELRHSVEDNKQLMMAQGSYMEIGAPMHLSRELRLSENASSSSSSSMLRKMHNNKVALDHFKKLRSTLKIVIRGKRQEKNRIVRDALHHKVPYGHKASKDLHNDSSSRICQPGSEFGKTPQQSFKRVAFIDKRLDRYNQLLETNSNREAQGISSKDSITSKEDNSSSSVPKRRPATLARIFSLPELRPSSSIQIEDNATGKSLQMPDRTAVGDTSDLTKQKPLYVVSEKELQPDAFWASESQQNLSDFAKKPYDWVNSQACESAPSHASNLGSVLSSSPLPSEQNQVSQNDFDFQEGEICQGLAVLASEDVKEDSSVIQQENAIDIDTQEIKVKQYYDDLLPFQVDAKNDTAFTFVRDVLDLSGFSKDEILGKWYSAEHPVDPMVFDEVEECLVAQNEWCANEEVEICDRFHLFDLINEVLLGIYERSCCYWPMPLTIQSCIHQMPKGHHVLEEVWAEINWLLSSALDIDQTVDDLIIRDSAKYDGWMNLQFDTECVGLEVEDLIFDDLLEEIISALVSNGLVLLENLVECK